MAFFWGQNVADTVWQPGSAWTCWRRLQRSPTPSRIWGGHFAASERTPNGRQERKGEKEKEERVGIREGRKEGSGRWDGRGLFPHLSYPSCTPDLWYCTSFATVRSFCVISVFRRSMRLLAFSMCDCFSLIFVSHDCNCVRHATAASYKWAECSFACCVYSKTYPNITMR